ncbi:hypothetical protein DAPPUDRAFT_108038 [Daphnia pulex]|uniref:Uncharacterized protein n=1 Tax=Daphnia pulex TaxID=6669 RepID=E9GYZ1_DAPPU|nr:hypothetical protein DAPPUDRAFT_108038 [Daphnia pulex]|eukprot:EFX75238.1 hypothetical protein DAPPUDRAFT_108038 [Daphnia pulex]
MLKFFQTKQILQWISELKLNCFARTFVYGLGVRRNCTNILEQFLTPEEGSLEFREHSEAAIGRALSKAKLPDSGNCSSISVQYVGVACMDGRSLRMDFLTLLLNVMESKLNERRPADVEMHFTAGFFSAIAVLQDNITRRFVIEHLGKTNFLRGLNGLGLGDFLLDNCDVHVLFRDDPVSGDCLVSILRTTTNPDHTTDYIERHTFQLFARFIAEVNGTPVSINIRPTPVAGNISKTAAIILDTEYHCSGM